MVSHAISQSVIYVQQVTFFLLCMFLRVYYQKWIMMIDVIGHCNWSDLENWRIGSFSEQNFVQKISNFVIWKAVEFELFIECFLTFGPVSFFYYQSKLHLLTILKVLTGCSDPSLNSGENLRLSCDLMHDLARALEKLVCKKPCVRSEDSRRVWTKVRLNFMESNGSLREKGRIVDQVSFFSTRGPYLVL